MHVLTFEQVGRKDIALVGGKGANLGELARLEWANVPDGFCITTAAFDGVTVAAPELPADVVAEIVTHLTRLGIDGAYAVRSSATAEDSPTASFAGQHDSYLDVVGVEAVLQHVLMCWSSMFSERAVAYRQRNQLDARSVRMAVVVQRMVPAVAAGVMFTADPANSNRRVVAIEAVAGLGEALVSGHVNPDSFRIRDGQSVTRAIQSDQPILTDQQVLQLAELGRRIEAHFGSPQDIEWCLSPTGEFSIVQSRPITTLFPIPKASDDKPHVYVSVGHQQMMTDAMKPLGISVWQLLAARPMHEAGSRVFVEISDNLASPIAGPAVVGALAKSDPLIGDALHTLVARGFVPVVETASPAIPAAVAPADEIPTDPGIVSELMASTLATVATSRREIDGLTGEALFDFILADFVEFKTALFRPQSHNAIMVGMEAATWLNEHILECLGEKNVADTLSLSAPNNVTAEMGLALLDVADVIRPHTEVISVLEQAEGDDFLDELPAVAGGPLARDAIVSYLERYGMRCVGEIDITRPRWSETPSTLIPVLLANVRNFGPGAGAAKFEQGRRVAAAKADEILSRLRELPDGEAKAEETSRMIDRVRTFAGYREFPKYGIVSRLFVYKHALLAEAQRLVDAGVLHTVDDAYFLRFEELHEAARTSRVDHELLQRRRDQFAADHALRPPRVFTSEGEVITGQYRRDDLPPDALVGLAVSAGIIEGRARVLHDMGDATIEAGDILVTAHTDPSWSPLFVTIGGLVTEVGGWMTHGAVIAREYGLPAVVGVENAMQLITDGQRIRVNGTHGHVELLP